MNAHHDGVSFHLPDVVGGAAWLRLVDTNLAPEEEGALFAFGHDYVVTGRSLLLFELSRRPAPQARKPQTSSKA